MRRILEIIKINKITDEIAQNVINVINCFPRQIIRFLREFFFRTLFFLILIPDDKEMDVYDIRMIQKRSS